MSETSPRTVFLCSCERTMPLHEGAVAAGCRGARVETGNQFCGAELDRVRGALQQGGPVTIGCTLQAPLFREAAEELGFAGELAFANVRETAGWSAEAERAGPKTAALLAAAAVAAPAPRAVTMSSEGVVLVYGQDEAAIEAGRALAGELDVTVLLSRPAEVAPPRQIEFPIAKGTIRTATGHLGAFDLVVDDFALPLPSSRERLVFAPGRNGAASRCDIVLDLTGGAPLFPAHELRDGYLRADPRDRAAVERAVRRAADLVGEFQKPVFIDFEAALCAHSRSKITGCRRCLDLCPTGAITPAGNHVAIDPFVCAGCGSCAAACPTGAAAYALPPVDALLTRVRTMLLAYRAAAGREAILLLHDADHGEPLVEALGRYGAGLPAHVLPLAVNEITQVGVETVSAALAFGASAVRVLGRARPKHDMDGLHRTVTLANILAESLGYGSERCALIETDDPDQLAEALAAVAPAVPSPQPSSFMPLGTKRSILESAMRELHRAAPVPVDVVPLPAGAPFGGLDIAVEGCTLCLSCVSACPTGALSDSPDRPMLRFAESACVQCGLCAATCPEKVIALQPRVDFAAWTAPRRTVKEEEPFCCIACGKAFGTKSTVDRIVAKLEGRHWMFAGANSRRLDLVRMCEDCRVQAVTNESLDPYTIERPAPRTTEDYLREREAGPAD